MNKTNKKGIELNQAFGAIITVVLVALLVIVSIVIFTSMNTATVVTGTSASVVNESLGRATDLGITLTTGNSARDGTCRAITAIWNTTNAYQIALANISQTGCRVINTTDVLGDGATWLYSYPYTYSLETSASNASTSFITNFSGYPALIGLVGTIIFLALVIGVLVDSFAFGNKPGV